MEIETLERRRVVDPAAGEALPQAKEQLAATEKQWRHLAGEQERLTIRARRGGTVVPLFGKAADDSSPSDEEPPASPLDPDRRGAYLTSGTPLCAIGDPARLSAELFIEQGDVEFVQVGQTVRVRFDAQPEKTVEGRITEMAEVARIDVPDELRTKLPERNDAARSSHNRTLYVARVELPTDLPELPIGSIGSARIEAAPQSFAKRLHRWFNATIQF